MAGRSGAPSGGEGAGSRATAGHPGANRPAARTSRAQELARHSKAMPGTEAQMSEAKRGRPLPPQVAIGAAGEAGTTPWAGVHGISGMVAAISGGIAIVTAAWAAMPSPRPVKPRPSLEVALTLTRDRSTASKPATLARMAS